MREHQGTWNQACYTRLAGYFWNEIGQKGADDKQESFMDGAMRNGSELLKQKGNCKADQDPNENWQNA